MKKDTKNTQELNATIKVNKENGYYNLVIESVEGFDVENIKVRMVFPSTKLLCALYHHLNK